jgi:oligoendopeptidase F
MTLAHPLDWNQIQPHFANLQNQELDQHNVDTWLQDWSDLESQIYEVYSRAYRAKMENTADADAEASFTELLEHVLPPVTVAANQLKEKLVGHVGYQPSPETREFYKRIKTEAQIFRPENVALFTDLSKLEIEYDKLVGSLEIELEGQTLTLYEAHAKLESTDRNLRERVFKLMVQSYGAIRDELDSIFLKMLTLRRQIARNAGFQNYREFVWLAKARFDYDPQDSLRLHRIIQEQVVPVASKLYLKRRERFGLESLKPWDVNVPYDGRAPLKPFENVSELETKISNMFHSLDADLGGQFDSLRAANLNLDSRAGKGPGGYCDFFPASGEAYIFMNAVGTHDDVQTMLHEGGHAFHALESFKHQRLHWNYHGPMEFCEVASMGMELLAAPYLERDKGGFYNSEDANRARTMHLRSSGVLFLPYMAVVDAFQHWLYVDAPEDIGIDQIHQKWVQLHEAFLPDVNYQGVEAGHSMRWQLQSHIFTAPFYYIEYGIAQLGALQLWQHSLKNPHQTVQQYRHALGLGYTEGLANLFSAAGIQLPFDEKVVKDVMELVSAHLELQ